MNDIVIHICLLVNGVANAFGRSVLRPLELLPGISGGVIVAVVSGILILLAFKYTSNQSAVRETRDGIKAELLALSLFRDSLSVNFHSQLQILLGAFRLMMLSLIPVIWMIIPVTLTISQLSLWWQARPVRIGEDFVVTVALNSQTGKSWPKIALQASPTINITNGPYRIRSRNEICWQLHADTAGYHQLKFDIDGVLAEKELAVGSGVMRLSLQKPGWGVTEILQHPAESPFERNSPLKSIGVQYPSDTCWTRSRYSQYFFNSWLAFWFAGSTLAALGFRRRLKVNL